MIEIIAHPTCPTCGGEGVTGPGTFVRTDAGHQLMRANCPTCNGVGALPRVLATFADAAELLAVINESIGGSSGDMALLPTVVVGRAGSTVLAALGVTDDHA